MADPEDGDDLFADLYVLSSLTFLSEAYPIPSTVMMPTRPLLARLQLSRPPSPPSLSQPWLRLLPLLHRAPNPLRLTLTNRNLLLSLWDMIMGTTMVLETLMVLPPPTKRLPSPSLTEQELRKTGKFIINIHPNLNL